METKETLSFNELKKAQVELLKEARLKIIKALDKKQNITLGKKSGEGKGRKNRLANYAWIPIFYKEEQLYWITLFRNHTDEKSGNFHTIHGEICFVKPFSFSKEDPFDMYSTKINNKVKRNILEFFPENWESPCKYMDEKKESLTVDDILAEDFQMDAFADAFMKYAEQKEKC